MKEPKIHTYYPDWHNGHSWKMRVDEGSLGEILQIGVDTAASMTITPNGKHWTGERGYLAKYSVLNSNSKIEGEVEFSESELLRAFDNSEDYEVDEMDKHILERFGGTDASQGVFIRWKEFLNIPCPGAGFQGDPNVSITVTDEMKDYVKGFVETIGDFGAGASSSSKNTTSEVGGSFKKDGYNIPD